MTLSSRDCEIITYDSTVDAGGVLFTPIYSHNLPENKRRVAYELAVDNRRIVYLSEGMLERDTEELARTALSSADEVILGSYGTKYGEIKYLYSEYLNGRGVYIEGERTALTAKAQRKCDLIGIRVHAHQKQYRLYVE